MAGGGGMLQGGGTAMGGNGAGGSSAGGMGAGGSGGTPVCNPPSGPGGPPVFYSRLDDLVSVTNPDRGSGAGALVTTVPTDDFVTSPCGSAVVVDQASEYVSWANQVDLQTGSISLRFRNLSGGVSAGSRHIFASKGSAGAHRLTVELNPASGLVVTHRDEGDAPHATAAGGISLLNSGNWVHVLITWDTTVNGQMVRVHFDDVEATYSAIAIGPINIQASNGATMILGAFTTSDTGVSVAELDEFAIYDYALP
jgi:hypothetical protein